jgi:outer membrane lipoprotein
VSRVAPTPILAQTVAGGTRPGYGTSMAARLTLLLVGLLLAGCGSVFPKASLVGVNRALTLEELRRDPDAHRGERVVLGGEILATTPKVGQTEIEVLSRPLGESDAPKRTDRSDGRFLAVTPDFLDPAIYSAGRRLTVLGTVVGGEERKLGELPYRYPLIRVERMYLWAQDVLLGGYPYYGDPFLYGPPGFYVGGYWGRRFPGPPYPFWW